MVLLCNIRYKAVMRTEDTWLVKCYITASDAGRQSYELL